MHPLDSDCYALATVVWSSAGGVSGGVWSCVRSWQRWEIPSWQQLVWDSVCVGGFDEGYWYLCGFRPNKMIPSSLWLSYSTMLIGVDWCWLSLINSSHITEIHEHPDCGFCFLFFCCCLFFLAHKHSMDSKRRVMRNLNSNLNFLMYFYKVNFILAAVTYSPLLGMNSQV